MKKEFFKKIKLPDKSGVYFFLKGKEVLYIGKATSLKDRVRSYFSLDLIEARGPIILDMVFRADKIKWKVTDSVLEALILEVNLIKKYQPKYNTKEKSDKSFNYVCITKEEIPKILTIRGKSLENHKGIFFGPYPNGSQLKEALKIIRKIFPFLDEKSKNYLEFYKQINLAPDLKDKKLYMQNIKNITLFFKGKKKKVLKNLAKEMKEYAKKKEFEKAGEIKRQIFALQHINDVALIKEQNFHAESENILPKNHLVRLEAYDVAHMGGKNMVGVMIVVENGEAIKSEYRKFKIKTQENANDTGALKEVLERRLAHKEWNYPNMIVVDGGRAQINVAKNVLKKLNADIPIISAVKDEKHKVREILGDKRLLLKYEREILLANSEAHRFAINYHKKMRNKNFLK